MQREREGKRYEPLRVKPGECFPLFHPGDIPTSLQIAAEPVRAVQSDFLLDLPFGAPLQMRVYLRERDYTTPYQTYSPFGKDGYEAVLEGKEPDMRPAKRPLLLVRNSLPSNEEIGARFAFIDNKYGGMLNPKFKNYLHSLQLHLEIEDGIAYVSRTLTFGVIFNFFQRYVNGEREKLPPFKYRRGGDKRGIKMEIPISPKSLPRVNSRITANEFLLP